MHSDVILNEGEDIDEETAVYNNIKNVSNNINPDQISAVIIYLY